jgi:hypothetical protein
MEIAVSPLSKYFDNQYLLIGNQNILKRGGKKPFKNK